MISSTARRCLSLIGGLKLVKHHRPDGEAGLEWDRTATELTLHVMRMDEASMQEELELLLAGLRDEWQCYLGEQVAIGMGLATRGLLDG